MKMTLRALRVNKGLTQNDVAKKIGKHTQTIYNWEKRKTQPTFKDAVKLAELYEFDVKDITDLFF